MGESQDAEDSGIDFPERRPGEDALWDSLGDEWKLVTGLRAELRVYLRIAATASGLPRVTGVCATSPVSVTSDDLRSIPLRILTEAISFDEDPTPHMPPLTREPGEDPEEFAARVAEYYKVFSSVSRKPAKEIADLSGVPVGTVRGWIREARLRGKLPPGTRGRAG